MGLGPMTGRGAGYCVGFGVPGFMNLGMGRGFWGRGGGRGWRHCYYATGLPGWARAGWGLPAWGGPYPYAAPVPPEGVEEAGLESLKAQAGSLERTLQALRRRIEKLEGESKAE
jgi:hypothetical protein